MKTSLKIIVVIVLLSAISFTIPNCGPTQPIKVTLSFSKTPALNKPVKVKATFKLIDQYFLDELKDVTAQILITDEFELVDGNLEWTGNLSKSKILTMNATVKLTKTGIYLIAARASNAINHASGDDWWYVNVTENGVSVSKFRPVIGTHTPNQVSPPPGYPTPSIPPVKPLKNGIQCNPNEAFLNTGQNVNLNIEPPTE